VLVGSAISSAADPVRIGLSLALSGQYYELGTMHERAYYLWQNEINEKGGLLGRPVEIIIEDDESDPEKAREIYRKLIFEDKVDLVFGPYSSRITAAVLPIVDEAGYPLLAAGASSDRLWQRKRSPLSIRMTSFRSVPRKASTSGPPSSGSILSVFRSSKKVNETLFRLLSRRGRQSRIC
jgi:ABC-type branched-subunit amino acid transport system substrate-binding protein